MFMASLFYRIWRRKPVFRLGLGRPDFVTYFASGGRRAGLRAQRCLIMAIDDGKVVISPWFPFNMFFFPELLGLEDTIPLSNVIQVCEFPRRFWGTRIEVSWIDSQSREITGSYIVPSADRFLDELKKCGVKISSLGTAGEIA